MLAGEVAEHLGTALKIKICGITNAEDALAAAEYGADALGFVFYSGSPRHVAPESARSIIEQLPPFITTVGVFVNEAVENICRIQAETGVGVVQLHGEELPDVCLAFPHAIKAFRVRTLTDLAPFSRYHADAFLLDAYSPGAYGGTGQIFNWDIAVEAKKFGRIILAGGLTPDNIARAIDHVRPYAVDVSSGVEERKGKKDLEKVRLFIQRAKVASLPPS
ncbi:MAG TPA: phosphoribosylanthranilate isomerase [Dissulfurispiraceae bacterium]|nr:phosphoribosylanthranilate isomerase [Dissulfurispiraceae bacterium]